jgi:phosphomannomutase
MNILPEIVREYDIRGVYGKNLFDNTAYYIGYALGQKAMNHAQSIGVDNATINMGFDGRLSSPNLVKNLVKGAIATGCNVNNVGLVPTPTLYFANFFLENISYGVMITASHNPKEYNGFKFISNVEDFYGEKLQKFADLINKPQQNDIVTQYGVENHIEIKNAYMDIILAEISDLDLSDKKIAWDPACGAAGEIIELLDKNLASKNYLINSQIDGTFPAHDPDPTIEKNLTQLKNLVKKYQCDIGIAFDGDADRVGVIDDEGEVIWGDQLVSLFASDILPENKGATIIADVKTSNIFKQKVTEYGGKPLIWKTGHSLIKAKMKETNALLAGEMSGHIFFKDRYFGFDDGIYAALRLIRILAKNNLKLSDYRKSLPKTFSTKEDKIACSEDKKFLVIENLKNILQEKGIEFLGIDGVRVENEQGWWLIRASNTSPYLVTRCEGYNTKNLADLKAELTAMLQLIL